MNPSLPKNSNPTRVQIVAVLNMSPDSFFKASSRTSFEEALAYSRQLIEAGADILDIGGESTRPATPFHQKQGPLVEVSEDEELQRIIPLIKALRAEFPSQKLSVDTRRTQIAQEALSLGVHFINHVCDSVDPQLARVLSEFPESRLVLCHMRGQPQNMQAGNFHEGPIVPYLREWFETQIALLTKHGVSASQIILDPGIGFGKRKPDQDLEILKGIPELKALGFPVFIGLSRKSFMGQILNKKAEDLLPATLVMNTYALLQGADYIRVHDVREHRDLVSLLP